jgi:transcription antitermination factor NusG
VPLFRNRRGNVELMFGTYFFVNFDLQRDCWEHIAHIMGVQQLLSLSSTTPSPLPVGAIESLIDRIGPNGVVDERRVEAPIEVAKPQPRKFNVADLLGRPLRVTDGPFTSFHCVGISSLKDRIKVLLDIFGRTSEVDLKFNQVEPI